MTSSLSSSHSLSDMEAAHYYAGLPSYPRLVARTGTTPWHMPRGLEAYCRLKQLGVVVNHKLNSIWERDVAPKIFACLDDLTVPWTSVDIVRIGVVGEPSPAPVVLWIGVKPKSLAGEAARAAAFKCLDVLKEFGIADVDVEIRESSVVRSAGPTLLPPTFSSNPTVAVRGPLTHTLGLPISAEATPKIMGTGGFFMAEGNGSDELLLVTARHVVLPPSEVANIEFERKSESHPPFNILLPNAAYESCLASIKAGISEREAVIKDCELRLKTVEGQDDKEADEEREAATGEMKVAKKAMDALHAFDNDVVKHWATPASRILGHVVYSPPICFGAGTADEQYTEDYAIIKINKDKIDRSTFKGNVIDMGVKSKTQEFKDKMFYNAQNPTPNRLLTLRGTISDEQMRNPTSLDQNNKPCLMVIKNGSTTGVTIGRASGIKSYVREYFDDGSSPKTSLEWAIFQYDANSSAFSDKGDSGAVIVDGLGRIGGLLTGGSGVTETFKLDITYATPIAFLLKSIKAQFPNAHLNLD